jgi:hypothetical protein
MENLRKNTTFICKKTTVKTACFITWKGKVIRRMARLPKVMAAWATDGKCKKVTGKWLY